MINNNMRAKDFITETPLQDLENRLPKIKSDNTMSMKKVNFIITQRRLGNKIIKQENN